MLKADISLEQLKLTIKDQADEPLKLSSILEKGLTGQCKVTNIDLNESAQGLYFDLKESDDFAIEVDDFEKFHDTKNY